MSNEIREEFKASAQVIRDALEKHLVDFLPIAIKKAEDDLGKGIKGAVYTLLQEACRQEQRRTRHIFITAVVTFVLTVGGIGFLVGRYKGFI